MDEYICKYCGKICKNLNSLKQHEIRCKENPNKIVLPPSNFIKYNRSQEKKLCGSSNQYTKAKREGYIVNISDTTRYKLGKGWRNKIWSNDERKLQSKRMKLAVQNHPESYSSSNINGRVKHYKYHEYILDGLWELDVAKYLDNNNIKWERPLNGFKYEWNNSEHLYFPDFYLPEYNYYIEVKGYQRERDSYKWKSVKNLIIIKEKEITEIRNNQYDISIFLIN